MFDSTALNYPSTYAFNPARWYAEMGSGGAPQGVLSGVDSGNSPMRPTIASARHAGISVIPLLLLALIAYLLERRFIRLRASGSLK